MFDNIGGKIKSLAKIMTWVGIAISVILGLILLFSGDGILMICGVVEMVIGSIFSWIGSFLLYAVGQIAQNTDILAGRVTLNEIEEEDEKDEERLERLRQQAAVNNAAKKVEIKKAMSSYNMSAANNSTEIFSSSDKYIDVFCPHCGEKLSFTYTELRNGNVMECVFCNGSIDLRGFTK